MNKMVDITFKEGVRQSLKLLSVLKEQDILNKAIDIGGKVVTTTVVSTGALTFIFGDDRTKNTDPYEDDRKTKKENYYETFYRNGKKK